MDGLSAKLYPAGHLPGAAAILLTYNAPPNDLGLSRTFNVLYTGDFFCLMPGWLKDYPSKS